MTISRIAVSKDSLQFIPYSEKYLADLESKPEFKKWPLTILPKQNIMLFTGDTRNELDFIKASLNSNDAFDKSTSLRFCRGSNKGKP